MFTSTNGEQETLDSYFFHQVYLLIYEKYLYLLPIGKLYKYMHFTFTSEHTQEKRRKGNQHSPKWGVPQEHERANKTLSPGRRQHAPVYSPHCRRLHAWFHDTFINSGFSELWKGTNKWNRKMWFYFSLFAPKIIEISGLLNKDCSV